MSVEEALIVSGMAGGQFVDGKNVFRVGVDGVPTKCKLNTTIFTITSMMKQDVLWNGTMTSANGGLNVQFSYNCELRPPNLILIPHGKTPRKFIQKI